MNELIYLFCVTKDKPLLQPLIALDSTLRTVYHKDLYAVVGSVQECEFGNGYIDKMLGNNEWLMEKTQFHALVVEKVMQYGCVVPFRFATVFRNKDSMIVMLERYFSTLCEQLKYFRDKEEWGVKVYCNMDALRENLPKKDEAIIEIDREIRTSLPGKAFLLRMKRKELIKKRLNERIDEHGTMCSKRLSEKSFRVCTNRLLPRAVTGRRDEMICNYSFLVEKAMIEKYLDEIDALRNLSEGKAFGIDCTGPWPPYSFCITIDKTVLEPDGKKGKRKDAS